MFEKSYFFAPSAISAKLLTHTHKERERERERETDRPTDR